MFISVIVYVFHKVYIRSKKIALTCQGPMLSTSFRALEIVEPALPVGVNPSRNFHFLVSFPRRTISMGIFLRVEHKKNPLSSGFFHQNSDVELQT